MIIRQATLADTEAAGKIYDKARSFMRESGNPNQWNSRYPGKVDVAEDIKIGASYVAEEEGEVIATFFFRIGDDPTYGKIYDGQWLCDGPYAVIHRIAVKYPGRRIADFCFEECFKLYPNLRIDTHRDNIPMQKCLRRNGFSYCGIIHLENGEERLAYQKIQ